MLFTSKDNKQELLHRLVAAVNKSHGKAQGEDDDKIVPKSESDKNPPSEENHPLSILISVQPDLYELATMLVASEFIDVLSSSIKKHKSSILGFPE